MKRFHIVFIALIVSFVIIAIFKNNAMVFAQQTKGQGESNVTFQWAFGAIKNTETGPQFEAITRDTVMRTGDQIKFLLRIENKCFVYLIYHSSQGDLVVLFPYLLTESKYEFQTSRNYYIPEDDQWFELDEYTGTEKFYLLAADDRLAELEDLITDYNSADKSTKRTISKEIISKIRKLRKTNRNLKTHVEKPVTIIGKMRGTEKTKAAGVEDIADYAIEISAKNFFSRTFTIDHK